MPPCREAASSEGGANSAEVQAIVRPAEVRRRFWARDSRASTTVAGSMQSCLRCGTGVPRTTVLRWNCAWKLPDELSEGAWLQPDRTPCQLETRSVYRAWPSRGSPPRLGLVRSPGRDSTPESRAGGKWTSVRACCFPGRRPRRSWMQCCSSCRVRMMAAGEDPGGWPEGVIFNVALVGSPCKLPSKAGARPATGARASEPLSRAKKPTSRCKMPNISPGAIERDVSAQCLPARLTVYPAQVHRWIIFAQSLVSSLL